MLSDAIHAVDVELSKLQEILKKSITEMTDLEKWAVFFQYASDPAQRETVNEVIASKEALQMAGDRLMSVGQDGRARAVFRSRRMRQTDLQSDLAAAEDRGIRLGGERGIRIGVKNQRMEIACAMLANGESVEKIRQYTGLTKEGIESLFTEA